MKEFYGWVLAFVAGAVPGIIFGIISLRMWKITHLRVIDGGGKDYSLTIFSSLIKRKDLAFLEKEDALANLELIGRGGCGAVYKVELPGSNGKMIAIKEIYKPAHEATELTEEDSGQMNNQMRQIRSEIKIVGRIRHRNLIPLLAHVSRSDCHMLVFELMKNGSLHDHLREVFEGRKELNWLARYNIALGVAAGLEYLHVNSTPQIIHRDLKPGNILLDDDLEPRITDFGLAKVMPHGRTHILASNAAGTYGYFSPNYDDFHVTDKFDIYSFGLLLGVLVMGKFPNDVFFYDSDEGSLVKWMRSVMTSANPKQAIDSKLMGNGYEDQMLMVLKIACFCTHDNPKERPNSKDVRCMLSQIEH